MPLVTDYEVTFEGGNREPTVVHLYGSSGPMSHIRFIEPEMVPSSYSDSTAGGYIYMALPSTMVEDVIDILRNEGPVYIDYGSGLALLSTSEEPVGEAE